MSHETLLGPRGNSKLAGEVPNQRPRGKPGIDNSGAEKWRSKVSPEWVKLIASLMSLLNLYL